MALVMQIGTVVLWGGVVEFLVDAIWRAAGSDADGEGAVGGSGLSLRY